MKVLRALVLGAAVLALPACSGSTSLNARDVYTIIDEIDVAVRAEAVLEPTVLLASAAATNASSPEDAAERLWAGFAKHPCVEAVRDGATVSVVYSAARYGCGSGIGDLAPTVSGQQTIAFLQADGETTIIDHAWKGLTDGYLTIEGTAHVTTAATAYGSSQHLVNALSWVRASDGKSGHGKDERTTPVTSTVGEQLPLPTGLRTWESDAGSWEMRPIDARIQGSNDGIPFVGTYAIVTPTGLALTLSITYGAKGAQLTLTDGNRSYSFGLSPNGNPTE